MFIKKKKMQILHNLIKTDTKLAFNQMTFPPWSWGKAQRLRFGSILAVVHELYCVLSVWLLAVKWAVKGVQSSLVRFQSAQSSVFSGKGATTEQPIFSSTEGDEQDYLLVTAPSLWQPWETLGFVRELVCNHS